MPPAAEVTVYTLSRPATVNISPACGATVNPSTAKLPPELDPPFTNTVPYAGTLILVKPSPDVLYKSEFSATKTSSPKTSTPCVLYAVAYVLNVKAAAFAGLESNAGLIVSAVVLLVALKLTAPIVYVPVSYTHLRAHET